MGQQEILDYLKEQRKLNDEWFTIDQIKQAMRQKGFTKRQLELVCSCLYRLTLFKFVEFRGKGIWHHIKYFRYKK